MQSADGYKKMNSLLPDPIGSSTASTVGGSASSNQFAASEAARL